MRLDLNNLKERVACQRAILDRVLDDMRDVNSELKMMVEGLPSVDFLITGCENVVCSVSHTVCCG